MSSPSKRKPCRQISNGESTNLPLSSPEAGEDKKNSSKISASKSRELLETAISIDEDLDCSSLNDSYAATIEKVVHDYSFSENDTDTSMNVELFIKKSEQKKNSPKKDLFSRSPKKSPIKRPKKAVAKRYISPLSAVENLSADVNIEADMPTITSMLRNSPKKSTRKMSIGLGKKHKQFPEASSESETNSTMSSKDEASSPVKRILFPKRISGGRKRKANNTSELPVIKSPKKSILVSHDNPKQKRGIKSKLKFNEESSNESPRKRVKFEKTEPGPELDLSADQSIEALTELVRQKRIRPPYGRPYSVTGK